jgi:dihydroorotate dehydrogenase electron transfer subunit
MKIALQGTISDNQAINKDTFQLSIQCPSFSGSVLPGQFVQISTQGLNSTFLKRPISIYNYHENQLDLIYKVIGQGTQNLSQLLPNQTVDLIMPLGNSFTAPLSKNKILLLGGGMGIAPLVFYLNYYYPLFPSAHFTLYYGVSRSDEKINLAIPEQFNGTYLFHSDYSNDSYQGNLMDFFGSNHTIDYDLVLSCGPTQMMQAFSNLFASTATPMEVSLESNMACGYGVCLGCAFQTKEGSKTVCADGPVFSSNQIDWTKVWKN